MDRLDIVLVVNGLVASRSQAASYIKLGRVEVNGRIIKESGTLVDPKAKIKINVGFQYVSRAALKLESVAARLKIDFRGKLVLDVGSSTGGFTQFALRAGAKKVIAVDVGTDQLHPSLRADSRIELHEQTDIRDFKSDQKIDLVVSDVSFISLRDILPSVYKLVGSEARIVAMVKPQFEVAPAGFRHHGVIKNDKMRRAILRGFETWAKQYFIIEAKADSSVAGQNGNVERFYALKKLAH